MAKSNENCCGVVEIFGFSTGPIFIRRTGFKTPQANRPGRFLPIASRCSDIMLSGTFTNTPCYSICSASYQNLSSMAKSNENFCGVVQMFGFSTGPISIRRTRPWD
ncbi:hypothetical protein AVEN_4876-1 [Araneus ventricosus]|uniref:Uncharacterized protein n=1 Tax=Araneus ventricosus TaxID=182803 RepID=A0A4Y1ZPF0_ARAVE|nr:hypothetical protein AVEN_4876-1 [Araneus ventricosus]